MMKLTQKEAYLRPEMEVVLFGEDIITTSGGTEIFPDDGQNTLDQQVYNPFAEEPFGMTGF